MNQLASVPLSTFLKKEICLAGLFFLISSFILFSCDSRKPESNPIPSLKTQWYLPKIDSAVAALERIRSTALTTDSGFTQSVLENWRQDLRQSRRLFKEVETILAYAQKENYKYLNGPNILRVDEEDATNIRVLQPTGYQVLEEEIYADERAEEIDFQSIQNHARMTANRLRFIHANTPLDRFQDYHFLWMIRESMVRIATTGVTGFDSPVLENSLAEARFVHQGMRVILTRFQERFRDGSLLNQWMEQLSLSDQVLTGEFNQFDRFDYIKNHLHPQIGLWNQTVEDWEIEFPLTLAMTNRFESLFSPQAFNLGFFSDHRMPPLSPEKVSLGKRLFHEKRLSADTKMSCATCHLEAAGFADNQKTAFGLSRNTPTVAYAGLQHGAFLDKRTGGLEGQIVSVVESEMEFHSNLYEMEKSVAQDSSYVQAFAQIYRDSVNQFNIRNAIADYIRTLIPFNSKFDRNIKGEEESLSQSEINGFNLFMGKAKCATCHFPPVFNGTVPPHFSDTEIEHLGVPSEPVTAGAKISPDPGRYVVFKTENRRHFFKTPTVRNAGLTAPYMHNGVYASLEEVVDFYNRGGGIGIGIEGPEVEFQTLPPDTLNLIPQEQQDLIAFMKSLNDESY